MVLTEDNAKSNENKSRDEPLRENSSAPRFAKNSSRAAASQYHCADAVHQHVDVLNGREAAAGRPPPCFSLSNKQSKTKNISDCGTPVTGRS